MEKPRVFIGSSREGLRYAEAIFAYLTHHVRCKLWTHDVFRPGDYPLEALERELRRDDFAIMVASADDELIKRGANYQIMRDNLLIEFGLFSGALGGRRRAFFVCPSKPRLDLPSDLAGLTIETYDAERIANGADDPSELAAAVQVPCQRVRDVILAEHRESTRLAQEREQQLRSSEKGQAVRRLYGLAGQLRDALLVVQRDALAAFSDETAFKGVRERASEKLKELGSSLRSDAANVDATAQVETLTHVAATALADLPFPQELAVNRGDARSLARSTGIGAAKTLLTGEDPVQYIRNISTQEFATRVEGLRARYAEWWSRHESILRTATNDLQDVLFRTLMGLAAST